VTDEFEEPLPIGIWLSELRKLARSCANDNGDAEDRAVRRAFHFLKLSPRPIAAAWNFRLSEDEIEQMLDHGRAQDAAREIVGSSTAVELSQSQTGPRHVAVLRFDGDAPVQAEGATPALAMISAWARLLTAAG
jgi:hypothetical protein